MPQVVGMPLELEEKGDFVILNKDIADFSLGDKGDIDFVIIRDPGNDVFIEPFPLTDSFSIPELHVRAITNNGPEEIIVGSYAIRENMAYLLERVCTTKYRTSGDNRSQTDRKVAWYTDYCNQGSCRERLSFAFCHHGI